MTAVDPFSLSGKLAVVTGARRGIGLAIAEGLAAAGADIIAISQSQEAAGSELERRVTAHGRTFTGIRADLADRRRLDEVIEQLVQLPPIDVLVNNAGAVLRSPALSIEDDAWDRLIELNLSSVFRLTREVGRAMVQRGSGKIIFIGSMLSFQGGINVAAYTATKSAVAGLTRALSNEWASSGVNVNAIAPGYIDTDLNDALIADPARNEAIVQRIPTGRWGRADDIAGAAVFLASAASDYVNGVVLPVDGGWLGR